MKTLLIDRKDAVELESNDAASLSEHERSFDRSPRAVRRTVIEPRSSWSLSRLAEVWLYRELIGMFAWRDVTVRYKQTIAGVAWAVLQPLSMMFIFSVIFRRWAHMPSQGVPYPLFSLAAVLLWQYFAGATSASAASLLKNAHIMTKVYFPRLVIPLSSVLPPLMDLAIGLCVLTAMLTFYGVTPCWRWILIPVPVAATVTLALGVGIWLSALNVEYRDLSHVIPFGIQLWMFASPIVYPSDLVSYNWRAVYNLNPMVGIIDSFRWILLGTITDLHTSLYSALFVTMAVLVSGILYFHSTERTFADSI